MERLQSPWCRFGIAAAVWVTTASCFSGVLRYPTRWSDRTPAERNQCPDIWGVYSNRGEAQPAKADVLLSELFRAEAPSENVTHVELVRSAWFVEALLWKDESLVEKRLLAYDSAQCKANGLELLDLGDSYDDSGVGAGAFFGGQETQLTKANDGSLVVHGIQREYGVIVLIPFYRRESLWYRFPPVAEVAGAD